MSNLEPIVLFRVDYQSEEEREIARQYFDVVSSRVGLEGRLVIGRYSVLPFYRELESDLLKQGAELINTAAQHEFIAEFVYYTAVEDMTPKTYLGFDNIPLEGGPFVVKGAINSRKFEWNTKMFAPTPKDALRIALDLTRDDPLVREQGIVVREFVPLKVLGHGLNDLPYANEWRFFFYRNTRLSHAFYWQACETVGTIDAEGLAFAQQAADRLGDYLDFYVIDIAEKRDGGWILIEVNDGQMSGLSGNDPHLLYRNLKAALSPS